MTDTTPTTPTEAMPDYPEHTKMAAWSEDSQTIGEFLEWLTGEHGIVLGRYVGGNRHLYVTHESIERLLAAYFEIDLAKVETEKRAMLAGVRGAPGDTNG